MVDPDRFDTLMKIAVTSLILSAMLFLAGLNGEEHPRTVSPIRTMIAAFQH